MNKITTVLFDADGTLFDTEGFHYEGWRKALAIYGIEFTKQDYIKYSGVYFEELARRVAKAYNLEDEIEEIMTNKLEAVSNIIDKESIKLMNFAKESIEYFREKNYKIGLVTSANKENTMLKLEHSNLLKSFEYIVTKDDVKEKKPHPECYQKGLKALDSKPEETIAFEDTNSGIKAAKAAGIKAVAIPNEFSKTQDFSDADKVFDNLKEAIDWIKIDNNLAIN